MKKAVKVISVNKIKSKTKKNIRYVIHLSDIHIRKDDRHEEYREVFNRLFKQLGDLNLTAENSVIVITGDIVHDKANLTGPSVNLVKDFFLGLSEITNIFYIVGNHDVNPNNEIEVDSVSPIVSKAFKSKHKIYYLEKGIYDYNNLRFGVTGMEDNEVLRCRKSKGKVRLGLYHGTISDSSTDIGYKFRHQKFRAGDFMKTYDYTLLGDIHKHQSYKNSDGKNIAWYAGSLIQQNVGEDLLEHGFVLLDIGKKTKKNWKHYRVKNDYGILKVNVDPNGKLDIREKDLLEAPKFLKLHVTNKSKDMDSVERVFEKFKSHGKHLIERTWDNTVEKINIKKEGNDDNLNLNDKNEILKYLDKKLDRHVDGDEMLKKRLLTKLNKMLEDIMKKVRKENHFIKLKKMTFSNLFRYGEDNEVNFENFNGIIGLSGENNVGKSALIDIIFYAIFGRLNRSGSLIDYLNINKKDFETEITLDVNNKEYKIKRSGKRTIRMNGKPDTVRSPKVYFYENGKNISKSGLKKTDKFIEEKICDPEDLLRSSVILQNDKFNFLKAKEREQIEYICEITGLNNLQGILDMSVKKVRQLKSQTTKKYKEVEKEGELYEIVDIYKLKKHVNDLLSTTEEELIKNKDDKDILLGDLTRTTEKITENRTKLSFFEDDLIDQPVESMIELKNNLKKNNKLKVNLEKDIRKITDERKLLVKELKKIKKPKTQLKKFNKEKEIRLKNETDLLGKLLRKINQVTIKMDEKKLIKDELKVEKDGKKLETKNTKLSKEIVKLNSILGGDKLEVDMDIYEKYKKTVNLVDETRLKIGKNSKELVNLNKKLEKFVDYEYDDKCKYCMKNTLTVQKTHILDQIGEIESDTKKLKKELNKLKKYLKSNDGIVEEYERMVKQEELISETRLKLGEKECMKQKLNLEILKLENKRKELKEERDKLLIMEENKKLEKKIKKKEILITEIKLEECEEYKKYEEIRGEIDDVDERTGDKEEELEEIEEKLETIETKMERREKNKKTEEKINELRRELELCVSEKEGCERKYKEEEDLEKLLRSKYNELLIKNVKIGKLKEEIDNSEKDRIDYEILTKLMKGRERTKDDVDGGIVYDILEDDILPILNKIVNNLTHNIGESSVNIYLEDGKIRITRENGTIISMNGGFVNHTLNLVFRLAFSIMSKRVSTNFVIVDEAFDACSISNRMRVIGLIGEMCRRVCYALVITHDIGVKGLWVNSLNIMGRDRVENGVKVRYSVIS